MLKDLPEEEFGPRIDFREYTFLENPSLPKQVKESFLEVRLCNEHSTRCSTANGTNKHRALLLPRNSTEQMVNYEEPTVVSGFSSAQHIIHLVTLVTL
ncbi:unnamed protein product [Triticum turgidum subsp. durum]|nr:unnamed protein product [Triticum turgidum subsp. durum]